MILRTELRRSAAPVIGIGFALITLVAIYGLTGPWHKGTAPWNEQWIGLAQWTRNLMMFLWPLVLGAGAWQGLRDKRSGVTELLGTTPRPRWRRALPLAGAVVLALLAGYLVVLVVGGVQVAAYASYFSTTWLPVVAVLILALAGSLLLGMGVGRLVPSLLTPPVLAILALAAQIAAARSDWLLLTPAFDGLDITVFTGVAPTVSATQAVWFLGIGATGFGLYVAVTARRRLVALLPVAVAAAIAVPILSDVDNVAVADPGSRELVCDGNVCVTRAHESYLPTLTGPARSALTRLRKLPNPPTSVVEVVPDEGYRPPPATVVPVFVGMDATGYSDPFPTDPAEIEQTMIGSAVVPDCRHGYSQADWEAYLARAVARSVAVGWVTGASGPAVDRTLWAEEHQRFEDAWQAFAALSPDEQRSRLVELRTAARACEPDLLSIVEGS
jgi:hypothetical protein